MVQSDIDGSRPIREIVREHEETRSPLLRAGLSPEEVGGMSLDAACAARGVDRDALLQDLEHAIEESAPFAHGAFTWDVRQDLVDLSPAFAELLKASTTRCSVSWILAHVHPGDRARVEKLVADAAARPRALSFEHRVVRKDGALRIFATRMEPLRQDATVLVGMTWDITEQPPLAVTLAPPSALPLLRSTLEATADGILVVDRSGNITAYNRRFLSLWRIPESAVARGTDEALLQCVLGQLCDPVQFLDGVKSLYASPERESFDTLRFKDDRVFERYSRPQRVDFAIVGRVWSFRDVTERERLIARMSFDADATRLLGSLDLDGALDAVARLAVPYLGDACAIDVFDAAGPHPTAMCAADPARRFAPTVPPAVRGGHAEIYEVDGRSEIAAPLCVRNVVVGAIVVSAALTERHTRADLEVLEDLASRIGTAVENARLLRETQDALRARDELVAVAAHELRGPVSAIHMGVQTLRRREVPERNREAMLEIIEREDRRLARFADDITEITKIRAGIWSFQDEDVDLVEIAREVMSRMATDIERSGSAVSISAPAAVTGRWDRVRLAQVITNLMSNALKFGLGKPIEIAITASDGWATLSVCDHGLGIARTQRDAIFEPFTRAVSVRHYGGLGLGLFIVRTIVVRYGGTVEVGPTPDNGSRFIVRLPQARPA